VSGRDNSGLPFVVRFELFHDREKPGDGRELMVLLSDRRTVYYRFIPMDDRGWPVLSQLMLDVGLSVVQSTDEMIGRLYHGDLAEWGNTNG